MLENPLAGDNISTIQARNKSPSAVIKKGLEFILHSCTPVLISQSTVIIGWHLGNDGACRG
jgi:hypothetical protein